MAGASVDDVFVIVMFSVFTALEQTGKVSMLAFAKIPVSIALGVLTGLLSGYALGKIFLHFYIRDTVKIILIMSVSFVFTVFEDKYGSVIPFSAMIGVMCSGLSIKKLIRSFRKDCRSDFQSCGCFLKFCFLCL